MLPKSNRAGVPVVAMLLILSFAACQPAADPVGEAGGEAGGEGATGDDGGAQSGQPQEVQLARVDVARDTAPDVSAATVDQLVGNNSAFAFDVYHQIAGQEAGNFVFSPYSISLAFAMVYAGARGETGQQIGDVMHFTLPQDQLHPAFNALDLELQTPLEALFAPTPTPDPTPGLPRPPLDSALHIANSAWGQHGYAFEEDYLTVLAQDYGAGLRLVDFAAQPEESRQAINQWVSEETAGRIEELFSPGMIHPATVLALVNAVYFRGEWTYPFFEQNTQDAPFRRLDGSTVRVPMMAGGGYTACARGDGYTALQLPYGPPTSQAMGDAAMLFLVPDEGTFAAFEAGLAADRFRETQGALEATNMLTTNVPRFEFDTSLDLIATLQAMGMTDAFGSEADFSGIAPGLFIDAAVHQANITVNEYGTEAAAATGVAMAVSAQMSACESPVILDRPFIFAIYDAQFQTLLFLGRVLDPSSG